MARNDQVTRQWLLLQKLENPRGITLKELAKSLPEDIGRHSRTIRRDLESLETRFPLVAERVNGETRWKLIEGFRQLPPLALSSTELMALVFSQDLLKPLDGTEIKASLDSALNKAGATLSAEGRAHVQQMRSYLSVGLGPHRVYHEHRQTISQLTRAITQNHTVQLRYYSASRDRTTRRDADPYRLWYAAGTLYLIAHCHTRRDVRLFAVERIRALTITSRPCQMPLAFDVEAYVSNALVAMRGEPVEVELLFDRKTAAWVEGQVWHPSQAAKRLKDGRLRLTLQVGDTPELVGWILHFGSGVQVVKPVSLKEKVRAEAREIFEGK